MSLRSSRLSPQEEKKHARLMIYLYTHAQAHCRGGQG
eukprot:CAMPEP_0204227016 /NCGR_PEP_ID=MMETSP0361-20130328/85375_1 /ASSEMBLY_ACC=CAM_ASM_000343 /TAXON_ID=268821 /ORGANISM="Scrippsiella Hangoei, Strain SHTV-5" /LENGTH=36 /DNA_ID= /DNA_START= /DNA_END= /DNA_ORIENTATION=